MIRPLQFYLQLCLERSGCDSTDNVFCEKQFPNRKVLILEESKADDPKAGVRLKFAA
jgi:hypothetical protein